MIIPLNEAVNRIKLGEAVAIPTETVYGLAARIDDQNAIRSIFTIKERPFFDPLIVHVSSYQQIELLSNGWGDLCRVLSQKFWPGPLTLVVPKKSKVSDLITSGLGTVGIRMPSHPLALEAINSVGVPLAAPSANKFGRTSPTSAEHVESEFKGQVPVVDGGACVIGLESTVLWVSEEQKKISLLRKGSILMSEIISALKSSGKDFEVILIEDKKESPGHMKHHYMPAVPLILVSGPRPSDFQKILQSQIQKLPEQIEGVQIVKSQFHQIHELHLSSDPAIASREFYGKLREIVEFGADGILFQIPQTWKSNEKYEALLERMQKAASLQFSFDQNPTRI